jgi:hypothetical protein
MRQSFFFSSLGKAVWEGKENRRGARYEGQGRSCGNSLQPNPGLRGHPAGCPDANHRLDFRMASFGPDRAVWTAQTLTSTHPRSNHKEKSERQRAGFAGQARASDASNSETRGPCRMPARSESLAVTTVFKVLRRLTNVKGTLSNKSGDSANVVFSLLQLQKVIDGVPGPSSGSGEIRFTDAQQAQELGSPGTTLYLAGGGIEARINLESGERFVVIGPVNTVR